MKIEIEPVKLFSSNRIDLVVGVDYVDYYERKLETDFFSMLYIAHKKSWNNLKDGTKQTEEDFISKFNKLIESIRKEKRNFELVPIVKTCEGFYLGNGFHRVSALYYYKCNVNCRVITWQQCDVRRNVDIHLFERGLRGPPLNTEYSHYIMSRFLQAYFKNYKCMVLFPNKKNLSSQIYSKFKDNIIYTLEIERGGYFDDNIIRLLYYHEDWVKGRATIKSENCFSQSPSNKRIKILFLKNFSNNDLVHIKKTIREYYKIGNHSVHTTDYTWENINLSHLFNSNTISFLKYTPTLFNNFGSFEKCFKNLKLFCKHNKIDTRRICVTSSAVLSVYCLRDCGDIDLLVDKEYVDIFKDSPFDTHNTYTDLGHYETTSDDIIYNPQNHFYYDGIKFCILEIIYSYKQYRIQNNLFSEASINKDKSDIRLIENSKKFKEKWW